KFGEAAAAYAKTLELMPGDAESLAGTTQASGGRKPLDSDRGSHAPRPPTPAGFRRCRAVLEGHRDDVNAVAISANGRIAVSAGADRTLRVWDLDDGRCLALLEGHTDSVNAVAVTSDGRFAVSGGSDRTLRWWDLFRGRCVRTMEGHRDWVTT